MFSRNCHALYIGLNLIVRPESEENILVKVFIFINSRLNGKQNKSTLTFVSFIEKFSKLESPPFIFVL